MVFTTLPFRVIVDDYVYRNRELAFSQEMKLDLIDLLNARTQFDEQNQFVTKAIELYVRSFFQALEEKDVRKFKLYEYKD